MATIQVDTDSMKKTQDDLSGNISKLKAEIKNLESITQAINQIWQGEKHEVYVKLYADYSKQLEEMIKGMEKYEKSLADARKKYVKCTSDVAGYVNKLRTN